MRGLATDAGKPLTAGATEALIVSDMDEPTNIEKPRIGAIAPWAGAKRTLAPLIVEELGPHRCYHEPFCGSMAVLLVKPECHMEVVNDLHGDLINLAFIIQDARLGPALYRRLRRVLFAADLFAAAARWMATAPPFSAGPDAERAFHFFIVCWMGRNGTAGTPTFNRHFCARFTYGGGNPAVRFAGAVDSIPAFRRRLRRVAIYQMDAFDLIARIADEQGTVIYCDPPYIKKGFRYKHEFAETDHRRLAEALRRFKRTRVVVSYYKHPMLDDLYPGWTRRDLECLKRLGLAVSRGSRANDAPEVLLINGPSLAVAREPSLLESVTDD